MKIFVFDFLKTLKHPPKVIITTAFREYAVDGFELDVVDYLLKPITFERFLKAINKFYQENADEQKQQNVSIPSASDEETYIYVKENKRVIKVYLNDIIYVEGLSEYVQIFTEKKKIITKTSMTNLLDKLPDEDFLRIHKSFIVSSRKIEAFTSSTIEVSGKEVPIGRSYKNTVMEVLQMQRNISN